MRTFPAGFLAAIGQEVTTLAVCWRVIRRDGIEILGTEHDVSIPITTGDYVGTYLAQAAITGSDVRSTADMAVDNLEVLGAFPETMLDTSASPQDLQLIDLNPADIEAGMFDNAEVTTFIVNYEAPDDYQHILRTGWIGNVTRKAEGEYRTELRGLTQALSQGIVRTYGVECDAELGDARCKVDLGPHTFSTFVSEVFSRREFQMDTTLGALPFSLNVPGGKVTWTSGLNEGYSMEIKDLSSLVFTLYLPMPRDIQEGDTFTVQRGCDKTLSTCINLYDNVLNFRGHGVFVPGEAEVLQRGAR